MDRTTKEALVKELHSELGASSAVYVTDPIGLDVAEVTKLRRSIKEADGKYRVVKNTLLRIASVDTPAAGIRDQFTGPSAVAIAEGDPLSVAKAIVEFAKTHDKFQIQGGVLGDKVLTVDDINRLASLPSKEVLLGKMLGSMNAPITNFVGVLAAMPRQLLYVLKAIEEKKAQA